MSDGPLLTVRLRFEHDVVIARQRAREAARLLDLGTQDQTRLATAVSELAREAFRRADEGYVRFALREEDPAALRVEVGLGPADPHDGDAEGRLRGAVEGARRLVGRVDVDDRSATVRVELEQVLPAAPSRAEVARAAERLRHHAPSNPFEELQLQNEELVRAMAALREQEEERSRLLQAEREAREDAQRAVRGREEVLSVVSHDLRNPIGAIITSATFLLENPSLLEELHAEDAPARSQLRAVLRSAQRAHRLIADLLDLSSIDQGKLSVERSREPVAPLLEEVEEVMEPRARERGLALDVRPAEGVPDVWGDRGRLVQVLENLVGNAVKFTPGGGTVRVRAEEVDGMVRFEVADTGPGIAEEEREHLFERFWQSSARSGGGAGLGLAIVKGIVESHGGAVDVASEVGRGTTFTFTIPAADGAHGDREAER